MRPHLVLLVAALLGVASAAGAQQGVPLSLSDALREVRQANPQLIALERQHQASRAAVPEARFLEAPMFETQIWGWPVTTLNPVRTDMYMFMAEQELPGRGKRAARELVAMRDAELAETQIARRANEIFTAVKQTYAELWLARATAELLGRQRPILEQTADAATIRYASGHSGQHDTVQAIVELSRLQTETVQWRERARLAETRLNVLLGRRPDSPVPALAAVPAALPAAADAERLALVRNPEMAMASAEIAREEAELARLRGDRRPDFVIGGGYMLQPGGAGAWTARAGITWPNAPWARGRLTTGIEAQERRVVAARARQEAIATGVRGAVHEAFVRITAARERSELLETAVIPHIEHAFDVALTSYASARADFADLLDTQRVLLATRMEVASARADQAMAVADLEMALGTVREGE